MPTKGTNRVEELEGRVLSKQQIIAFLNAEVDGLTRRNEQLAVEHETAISDLRTKLVAAEKHRQVDPAAEQVHPFKLLVVYVYRHTAPVLYLYLLFIVARGHFTKKYMPGCKEKGLCMQSGV